MIQELEQLKRVKLMLKKRRFLILFVILALVFTLTACQSKEKNANKKDLNGDKITKENSSEFLMDTIVDMQVYGKNAEEIINKSFERMREIENEMSKSIEESEVSKINRNATNDSVNISKDTFKVTISIIVKAFFELEKFDKLYNFYKEFMKKNYPDLINKFFTEIERQRLIKDDNKINEKISEFFTKENSIRYLLKLLIIYLCFETLKIK